MNDVTLVMTVYPPYSDLVDESVQAIERCWPGHPKLHVGQDRQLDLAARLRADVQQVGTEFVVVMHEDFRLCGPVAQQQFKRCLDLMRRDANIFSCSLTWEPCDHGIYHFPKQPYTDHFQTIPIGWDYAINFQMRLWRKTRLVRLLEKIPAGTTNSALEPLATKKFRRMFPGQVIVTYAIPDPPNPHTLVYLTDKSKWIVPYDNLIHAGKRRTPLRCPVYINNRDRLTTVRAMVEYLQHVKGAETIIVDNASTYPPLLQWYGSGVVEVMRFPNLGPQAPWKIRDLARGADYYIVTDADLDLTGVPLDVLEVLRDGLERYPNRIKAGLSLEIDDLPDTDESQVIRGWEKRFWRDRADNRFWNANVDTTFAMYRAGTGWRSVSPALRADRPYTARHVPWYQRMDDEELYYSEHANHQWSTWSGWDKPIAERPAYRVHQEAVAHGR